MNAKLLIFTIFFSCYKFHNFSLLLLFRMTLVLSVGLFTMWKWVHVHWFYMWFFFKFIIMIDVRSSGDSFYFSAVSWFKLIRFFVVVYMQFALFISFFFYRYFLLFLPPFLPFDFCPILFHIHTRNASKMNIVHWHWPISIFNWFLNM